jgi:hypothetical protein
MRLGARRPAHITFLFQRHFACCFRGTCSYPHQWSAWRAGPLCSLWPVRVLLYHWKKPLASITPLLRCSAWMAAFLALTRNWPAVTVSQGFRRAMWPLGTGEVPMRYSYGRCSSAGPRWGRHGLVSCKAAHSPGSRASRMKVLRKRR